MGRKLPHTPNSRIRSALRQLWLRSRERAARLKTDEYTCQRCGVKQSKAKGKEVKVEVHHVDGIRWAEIIEYVRANLLCNPVRLETVCVKCHKQENLNDNNQK